MQCRFLSHWHDSPCEKIHGARVNRTQVCSSRGTRLTTGPNVVCFVLFCYVFFYRHNSQLVWMVGICILWVYVDLFSFNPTRLLSCDVGAGLFGHMLFWVSYMHVFRIFCICSCFAQLSMFDIGQVLLKYNRYYFIFINRRSRRGVGGVFVCWLLNVPATC